MGQKRLTRNEAGVTYVWTGEVWLYLAVVPDLFSRRIVGWAMQASMERSPVLSALDRALATRMRQGDLLCHSDRGSQYASQDYQQALCAAKIRCSMSRQANCWDSAPVESFFGSLKRECVHRHRFATRQEAKTTLFAWGAVWCNRTRRHSSLGYVSPEIFEQQYQQQQKLARQVAC